MTQYQQVVDAVKKIGGKGTISEIFNATDTKNWKTHTKKASVASYLAMSNEFRREGHIWIYDENNNEILLHCSDGVLATAIAKCSKQQWTIFGISEVHGFGNADFEKDLFNTTFDEIIPFNTMTGVSYVAVRKGKMWGLIRFRQNPDFTANKKSFEKALGNEPIDEKAMDPIGREIKLIEDIKYPDINIFKKKYHLDNLNFPFDDNDEDYETSLELIQLREWSDELKEYTKNALSNLEFGVGQEGNVRMKRNDGSFGYIPFADAFNYKYNVHHDEDDIIDNYKNVSDMIEDGWVLD